MGEKLTSLLFFPMTPPKKNWIFHAGLPYSIRGAFQSPPSAYTHSLNSFTERMHTVFF